MRRYFLPSLAAALLGFSFVCIKPNYAGPQEDGEARIQQARSQIEQAQSQNQQAQAQLHQLEAKSQQAKDEANRVTQEFQAATQRAQSALDELNKIASTLPASTQTQPSAKTDADLKAAIDQATIANKNAEAAIKKLRAELATQPATTAPSAPN